MCKHTINGGGGAKMCVENDDEGEANVEMCNKYD